jgi:hypothetical protein
MTIGIALLIESVIVLLFPKSAFKTVKALVRNIKIMKKVEIITLIVAIIIILIGMNI